MVLDFIRIRFIVWKDIDYDRNVTSHKTYSKQQFGSMQMGDFG